MIRLQNNIIRYSLSLQGQFEIALNKRHLEAVEKPNYFDSADETEDRLMKLLMFVVTDKNIHNFNVVHTLDIF